ncbi:MAG: O-methyltransferase [Candidatus Kapabacteria bacterium]|nr:O-methyltransferase [Candidatus Kapabacteria bacterium]
MASSFTMVTPEIGEYIQQRFSTEDSFLRQLRDDMAEADIPAISIGGEQAAFLQVFLRSMNASRVLEIGSLGGYSSIAMARVLQGENRKMVCLEKEGDFCDFIERKAREAALETVIEVHSGEAMSTLQNVSWQLPFDAVFIDADKPNYLNYFHSVLPLVRKGGVIIADNTLAWGEIHNPNTTFEPDNVHALQEYNDHISGRTDVLSCLVPIGDGMTISYKL